MNGHRLTFEVSKPEGHQHDDRTCQCPRPPSPRTTSPRRVPIYCARWSRRSPTRSCPGPAHIRGLPWFTRRRRDRRDASMDDRAGFEWWRRRDEPGPRSQEASWDLEVSTVNEFYLWAGRREGRSHPSARGLRCCHRGGTGLAARWCGKCRPRRYATLVDVRFRPCIPAPARPATPTEPSGVDVRTEANLSRLRKENTDLPRTLARYEEAIRRPAFEIGALHSGGTVLPLPTAAGPRRPGLLNPTPPAGAWRARGRCGMARSRPPMVKESPAGQRARSGPALC